MHNLLMHIQDEKEIGAASHAEILPDTALKAFAQALGQELDRIGYPSAPMRTTQLSEDLELGRMQAYRIGRGDNMPTLKALLKLHSLGVSLDAVLAKIQTDPLHSAEVTVEIFGTTMKVRPLPAYARTMFAIAIREGHATMRMLAPSEELAVDERAVGGLRFTRPQGHVAVVEDSPNDLAVLCKQIEEGFNVQPFQWGRALVADAARLVALDAIVLDWRLPDIDGATLVNLIRAKTCAPIIITTGENQESYAISQVLHLPNIRYVSKPVDGSILRAMLTSAISEATAGAMNNRR
jgi:CheY-like chemotaxis protein